MGRSEELEDGVGAHLVTLFSVFMLSVKALAVLGAGGRGEENRQGQDREKMEAGTGQAWS